MGIQVSERGHGEIPGPKLLGFHLLCGFGLGSGFWIVHNGYGLNLISNPTQTLNCFWVVQCPIVILVYSLVRRNPEHCSALNQFSWAVGRGLVGLFVGLVINLFNASFLFMYFGVSYECIICLARAFLNAFGAIIFGAPIGIEYFPKTMNWSLLMSSFNLLFFGSSWKDWQQLFAHSKPIGYVDYMICLPAHGAIIGAWLGAWPVPLDWEKPWQEWPICVTYGAISGYLLGILASFIYILIHGKQQRVKTD